MKLSNIHCQIWEERSSKTKYLYWLNVVRISFWMITNNVMFPYRIIKSTFIFVNTGTIQDSITQRLHRYWRHVCEIITIVKTLAQYSWIAWCTMYIHIYVPKYFRMQMDVPKHRSIYILKYLGILPKTRIYGSSESAKYCDQSKVDEVLVSCGRYYHNMIIIVWYELSLSWC